MAETTPPGSPRTGPSKATPVSQEERILGDDAAPEHDRPESPDKQDGVRRAEAITRVWSRKTLILTFILLYLITLSDAIAGSVQGSLGPFITSSFKHHGLLAITGIVVVVVGGVSNLAVAKVLDIWGRAQGFAIMVAIALLGMLLTTTSQNVQMYAAGNTLDWVGSRGFSYIIDIMLVDMTSLRNYLITIGIKGTPTLASFFVGPPIAQLFNERSNWRWALGTGTIALLVFCAPVCVIFYISTQKARRLGIYPARESGRTAWQSAKYYFVQFDVVGLVCILFGWSLLLLPFSLVRTAPHGWKTGYIIATIVLGVLLLVAFVIWERFFSTVEYFPWHYLRNRTILCANLVYFFMFLSIQAWDTYYESYLQVVHFLDITKAAYVVYSFSLTSAFLGPFIGLLIRYTGDYKYLSLAGIPIAVLGTALLLKFRTPDSRIGLLVMCQVLQGIYSEIWALTARLAIMASLTHQQVAVALAIFGLFGSIGSAIGRAIAGAIWTNSMPQKLRLYLPDSAQADLDNIYSDIKVQLSYPRGSPERNAIIAAYGDVQRTFVIIGVCFMPILLICLLMWKGVNVKKLEAFQGKQKKGTIF